MLKFTVLILAAVLLTAALAAAQSSASAQEAGVCDRTEAVRDALVASIADAGTCADVTAAHLSAVTQVDLRHRDLTALSAGDLGGLAALAHLYLQGNHLTVVDVSSNTALLYLYAGGNQLGVLDVRHNTALTHL